MKVVGPVLFHLVIGFFFLFSSFSQAFPKLEKEIDFNFFKKAINHESCLQSDRSFLGCVAAVRSLLQSVSGLLDLEIRTVALSNHADVFQNYNDLVVVKKTEGTKYLAVNTLKQYDEQSTKLHSEFQKKYSLLYHRVRKEKSFSLGQVIHYIEQNYLSQLNQDSIAQALNKYLHIALDPHSDLRLKSEMMADRTNEKTSFVGVGIVYEPVRDGILLFHVLEGSGAEEAGLRPGDLIQSINNQSIAGFAREQVSPILRGEEGTTIRFQVHRQGQNFALTVTRKKVEEEVFEKKTLSIFNQKIGYIRLANFSYTTLCYETYQQLLRYEEAKVKGLILDLRGNLGGYVQIASCIAGLFLEEKKIIAYFEEKSGLQPVLNEDQDPKFTRPLVVLVDSASASGSELVAGALQDHNRALIVGQTTFGKGSRQAKTDESESMVLYQTDSLFFRPSGQTSQTKGIVPNLEVFRGLQPTEAELYPRTERNQHLFPIKPRTISASEDVANMNTMVVPQKCIQSGAVLQEYQSVEKTNYLHDIQVLTAAAVVSCL